VHQALDPADLPLAFRSVPVQADLAVAIIKPPSAANVPAQVFPRLNRENPYTRASLPHAAVVHLSKNVTPKANANYIRCARVPAQVRVAAPRQSRPSKR